MRWEQQGVPHMGELPPLLTPQGPGVARARRPGISRVDDSGTSRSSFVIFRQNRDLPLFCRIRFGCFVSDLPSTSRYWLLHGSPRPCCQVFPSVSIPFLASSFFHFVSHLHDPGSFSSPYACVSLQLQPSSYLSCVRFVLNLRRCIHAHMTLQLSSISFRISILPPRFRGSVFVARELRRSALTPLPRSGKEYRVMTGS